MSPIMVLSELSSIFSWFRKVTWHWFSDAVLLIGYSFWAMQLNWVLFICTFILCRPRLSERQSCILLAWGTMDDWCRLVLDNTFVWCRIFSVMSVFHRAQWKTTCPRQCCHLLKANQCNSHYSIIYTNPPHTPPTVHQLRITPTLMVTRLSVWSQTFFTVFLKTAFEFFSGSKHIFQELHLRGEFVLQYYWMQSMRSNGGAFVTVVLKWRVVLSVSYLVLMLRRKQGVCLCVL